MSEEYPEYKRGEERGFEGDGPNLRYDEFVERIVRDPNDPPGVTLLSGYLGASSEEACVRLYLDEELSRYVEIPEKAILHTQELTPEQSPLGGSLLWIDSGAEVTHGPVGTDRQRATFLEGQIAQDYMGAAQAGAFPGLSGSTQTRECFTPPSVSGPGCGTSKSGPCIPQTEFIGCRTRTGILCTRLGPNCGRTSFDPVCTIAGPNCRTLVFFQCQQSIAFPCVTHDIECQASGFFPCNPPVDFTIWQGQFGNAVAFGGQQPTGTPCIPQTVVACPSVNNFACPPPTSILTCRSGLGCEVGPADFAGGQHAFAAPQPAQPTASPACGPIQPPVPPTAGPACHGVIVPTRACAAPPPTQSRDCVTRLCPSAVDACPTRFNCPSLDAPCPSHLYRCPTQTDVCQSAYATCPTRSPLSCASRLPIQCGATQLYGCITQVGCGTLYQCQTQSPACGMEGTGGGF